MLQSRLSTPTGAFSLWETAGRPVSLVGWSGPTPNGVRIVPVYTPPSHRRRGYAATATAALCRDLLAGDRRWCFLFADLANPSANLIYQGIGFHPAGDVDEYAFAH